MEKRLRETLPAGNFNNVSGIDSKRMSAIHGRGNRTTEKRFRAALAQSGIRGWQVQPKSLSGKPDFFFPKHQIAVFVDGCFWHGCPGCGHIPRKNSTYWRTKIERNKERDQRTTGGLKAEGIRVVRYWEHELKDNLSTCIESIEFLLQKTGNHGSKVL